ncbi:MAG: hydrogenase maturation protease [Chloroflexi bacterium]|nr:hydrogenase maturation protease [Chloroflexota bacterium]
MSAGILVAGVGNELMGDDGFGIAAAHRCAQADLGPDVKVVEAGIAGIGLVQDLMDRYEVVIVLDAVDRGSVPGTIHVLELTVPEIDTMTAADRWELLTDMHYTIPSRVMILARALGVLPARAYLVGCQPAAMELGEGLSPAVAAGVSEAVTRTRELIEAARRTTTPATGAA